MYTGIEVIQEDGSKIVLNSDVKGKKTFTLPSNISVSSVHIDPNRKITLDQNYINNSWTRTKVKPGVNKAGITAGGWGYMIFEFLSLLF